MNILEWMTNDRMYDVNKRLQTNYGYHHEEEWQSIYFQLIIAIYVLIKNEIQHFTKNDYYIAEVIINYINQNKFICSEIQQNAKFLQFP